MAGNQGRCPGLAWVRPLACFDRALRNRNTIESIGIWEKINNAGFKPVEFDGIRKLAGLNSKSRADIKPMTALILSANGAASSQPRGTPWVRRTPRYLGLKARANGRAIGAGLQPLRLGLPNTQGVALGWYGSGRWPVLTSGLRA